MLKLWCRACGLRFFCRECGSKVEPVKKQKCRRECGAQLVDGGKFCSAYGATVVSVEELKKSVA